MISFPADISWKLNLPNGCDKVSLVAKKNHPRIHFQSLNFPGKDFFVFPATGPKFFAKKTEHFGTSVFPTLTFRELAMVFIPIIPKKPTKPCLTAFYNSQAEGPDSEAGLRGKHHGFVPLKSFAAKAARTPIPFPQSALPLEHPAGEVNQTTSGGCTKHIDSPSKKRPATAAPEVKTARKKPFEAEALSVTVHANKERATSPLHAQIAPFSSAQKAKIPAEIASTLEKPTKVGNSKAEPDVRLEKDPVGKIKIDVVGCRYEPQSICTA